jgi:UDP-N-acetylglucosamine 2-epimerase (non-hydrolysing)
MTLFNPAASTGSGPVHDVLLIAGSRAEAARMAPVADAMARAGRIEPFPVATGLEPMLVHDALESLGAPPAVTLLLGERPHSLVAAAAALAVRLDELMVDRDPSAVLLSGGGITAVIGAQVAFWRQIPVVYLEPGGDGALTRPFPENGNRRVISQLTSLFLRARGRPRGEFPGGPTAILVGDTLDAARTGPGLSDPTLADLVERARAGSVRIAMLDAAAGTVVEATAGLLAAHPDLEVVFVGLPIDADLVGHDRVRVLARSSLPELVALLAVSTVGATDQPSIAREAREFGLPTALVEQAERPHLTPGAVPADPAAVLVAATQLLASHPHGRVRSADRGAASRVEHALAWMFGLETDPLPDSVERPGPARPDSEDPAPR